MTLHHVTSYTPAERETGADHEFLSGTEGLYVGQLDAAELDAFNRLVAAGTAYRDYDHAGGFFGLAKVAFRSRP